MTLVEAKVIGNELGTATVIGVGVDPAAKDVRRIAKESSDNGCK